MNKTQHTADNVGLPVLFIDIGNTRIKYTLNQTPFAVLFALHEQIERLSAFMTAHNVGSVLITAGRSAAARQALRGIEQYCRQQQIALTHVEADPTLLAVNYTDISQFGVDRYLHLLAGKARYQDNFCVVSCGTAITLDFYTDRHIGGMILPGLGLSKQLLAEKAGLHSIEKPNALLGNDTASTIGAGLYIGYKNLIYSSIKNIETEYNHSLMVGLTGGDADILYQYGDIIPTLLFSGMQCYHDYQSTQ